MKGYLDLYHRAARLTRLCSGLALMFILAGCASTISARVTSYQQWPADAAGATYRIVPPSNQNDLQYQAFADMLVASIGPTGLVQAQAGQAARFDVSFNYESVAGERWVQRSYDPYLNDGWGFSPFYGYYGGYSRWGGGVFYSPPVGNVQITVYQNKLTVIIKDNQKQGAEVYQSSAVHVSGSDNLTAVMPYLAQAVFDHFPGNNGQVRDVTYNLPD